MFAIRCLRLAGALALVHLISGCLIQRAQEARDAKARMIGMSGEQVFACMGPPSQKSAEGGTEI